MHVGNLLTWAVGNHHLTAFAFDPNGSDHNGIDDTVEKSKGNIKIAGGSLVWHRGGPLPLPECGEWKAGSLNHACPLYLLIMESQQIDFESHQKDHLDTATSFSSVEAGADGVKFL